MEHATNRTTSEGSRPAAAETGRPRWDASDLRSSYCNIAAARAARRTVVLDFGIDSGRERPGAELKLELLHRVTVQPVIAKHLQLLLSKLLGEHDARSAGAR